jgi:type IV pilus assembly protein PilM
MRRIGNMFQKSKGKTRPVVGLEIDGSSLAAAQVQVNGSASVTKAVIAPLPAGAFHDGEVSDPELLSDALRDAFGKNDISKDVRLGIGNQRVAFRTIRLPAIESPEEMDAAVRFQAQEEMPMPLDSAVLDYQMIGGSTDADGTPKVDVALVAARREMIARLLEPVRSAGLRPVAVDLNAFGLIRALAGVHNAEGGQEPEQSASGDFVPATLYCNLGDVTNLAVARGSSCLFARISPFGVEKIAERVTERAELTSEHARMWLEHVGLEKPVEEIEGDSAVVAAVRQGLEEGAGMLADELRLSLDYYGAQEGAVPVGPVILSGPASAIPGLPERLQRDLGRDVTARTPAALREYDSSQSARLTLAYGLALEQ